MLPEPVYLVPLFFTLTVHRQRDTAVERVSVKKKKITDTYVKTYSKNMSRMFIKTLYKIKALFVLKKMTWVGH